MIHRHIFTRLIVLSVAWSITVISLLAQQEVLSPDEVIEVDEPPVVDLVSLQKSIVYPKLAQRAGVEGQVIVRALVGVDGTMSRIEILESPNEWFNQAALDAVEKATARPAIKDGTPIPCWTLLPIGFRLHTPGRSFHPPAEKLINYLTLLISTNEHDKPANLYSRGLVYYKSRQKDNAESDFQRASQLAPSVHWKPYSDIGKEEIASIQARSTDAASLTRRGELFLEYDLQQALADVNAAIKADSNYLYAYAARASIYIRKGMCAEAVRDMKKSSSIAPETPALLADLSRCYYERKDYKQALLSSTRAIELAPSFAPARYIAALAILRMDDTYKKALDVYKETYSLDGHDESLRTQAVLDLQNLIKQNIRSDEAKKILKEVFHVE